MWDYWIGLIRDSLELYSWWKAWFLPFPHQKNLSYLHLQVSEAICLIGLDLQACRVWGASQEWTQPCLKMRSWRLHNRVISIPVKIKTKPKRTQLPPCLTREIPLLLLCGLFITEVKIKRLIRDNSGCQMNLFEISHLCNYMLAWCIYIFFLKCMKTSLPLSLLLVSHVLRGQMTCSFLILWNARLIESCDVS